MLGQLQAHAQVRSLDLSVSSETVTSTVGIIIASKILYWKWEFRYKERYTDFDTICLTKQLVNIFFTRELSEKHFTFLNNDEFESYTTFQWI